MKKKSAAKGVTKQVQVPKPLTKWEVLTRIKGLNGARAKATVCALVGHSRMTTYYFGYLYCGRCGAQVGDTLMSSTVSGLVVERHGAYANDPVAECDCTLVSKKLTWRDTLLVPESAEEWLKTGQRQE